MEKEFTVKHKCGHTEKYTFYGKSSGHCAAAARSAMFLNCLKCFSKLPIVKEAKKLDVL